MSERSLLPDTVSEPQGSAPDDLDDSVFEEIGKNIVELAGPRRASLRESIRETLRHLTDDLDETWLGGPPDAADDLERHVIGDLEQTAGNWQKAFLGKLGDWSKQLDKPLTDESGKPKALPRSQFFLYLWWESNLLWETTIAYRAVKALSAAMAEFAKESVPDGEQARSWEALAWPAVCRAMALIEADSWTFKQINLSSAAGLVRAAGEAAKTAAAVGQDLSRVLGALDGDPESDDVRLTWRGLRFLAAVARDAAIFYKTMASLASTVTEFEHWMASPRRPDIRPGHPARPTRPLASDRELCRSVDESLRLLYEAQNELKGPDLAECEPWEQLLVEMRKIIISADNKVFIPRRVWLRYCFPFAVEEAEGGGWVNLLRPPDQAMDGPSQISLAERLQELQKEFTRAFGRDAAGDDWITVDEPESLAQTQFFKVSDTDDNLFGGVRVGLSELEFTGGWQLGSSGEAVGHRCRVWLDMNQMGVLCLCVELIEPLEAPPPHVLFRALRTGSQFPVGDTVSLAGRPASAPPPAWDNLDAFARDIIKRVAGALYVAEDRRRKAEHDGSAATGYLGGNSHLIAVVQTDGQFETPSGDFMQPLDSAVGGRILLRPIQRALGTLAEWVRLPPWLHVEGRVHDAVAGVLPEIGYSGDWFVHIGDMSVFGIVATPPWVREAYLEAVQFANSWSPLLQLWNKSLQRAINPATLRRPAMGSGEELRKVEQQVRRRLAQINSEELCSTLTNRRFLDELLDAAGVGRLQAELETHLESAEQLTDWYNAKQQEKAAKQQEKAATRRDVWLFIIALLGIFSLGDFMLLANSTNLHGSFLFINLAPNGQWEDWFILTTFLAALIIGPLFVLGGYEKLRERLRSTWSKRKREKAAGTRRKSQVRPARQP